VIALARELVTGCDRRQQLGMNIVLENHISDLCLEIYVPRTRSGEKSRSLMRSALFETGAF
jgi:hypothetical protein